MLLKKFNINFKDLSKEKSLRFDVDFISFNIIKKDKTVFFKELFEIENFEKKERINFFKEIRDNDFFYCEIGNVTKQGDVEPIKLNFLERNEFVENYFKKIEKGDIQKPKKGNILLAKVRPNLKKFILIDDENKNFFYTTAFINLKPKKLNKILYYSLRTIFYKNLISISRQGKGYPTLKEEDLFYLKFNKNFIQKLERKKIEIISQIEPIEKKIKELKKQIKQPHEIINKVFAREFGFNFEKFNLLKNKKFNYVNFYDFANNKDLRQSVKFHRLAFKFVTKELKNVTKMKIKDFISEPIILGTGISPNEYDDFNGKYFYISMATIKDWYFEPKNARFVSNKFVEKNKNKIVKKYDILLARSGEGTIGKVALIDNKDIKGIFADFVMRIRFKNYNPLFAYYYFRTEYFQYLVEINKKGLGNNTNIFPSQIKEFPIPDIPLKEQERIVNEIKKELDKQEEMKKEIENLRNKIEEIIENAIK